jgi:hypothetical protein
MTDQQQIPTPGDVARTEAARQAVMLGFGLLGAVALIAMQRKFGGGLFEAIQMEADKVDPSGAARRRMDQALKDEARWRRAALVLWRVGPWRAARWAHRNAEKARARYEGERS